MRAVSTIAAALMLVLSACGTSTEPTFTATATFDGSECIYDGPAEFDLNSDLIVTFINTSEATSAGYSIWMVPDGVSRADVTERGISGVGATMSSHMRASALPSSPGIDKTLEVELDASGLWVVNCFRTSTSGPTDYPAAIVEVSSN